MSTVTEIAQAASRLSAEEQGELLRLLDKGPRKPAEPLTVEQRLQWLAELELLSASISTGRQVLSSEEILDDLRGE